MFTLPTLIFEELYSIGVASQEMLTQVAIAGARM